jgi:hypothetical protein
LPTLKTRDFSILSPPQWGRVGVNAVDLSIGTSIMETVNVIPAKAGIQSFRIFWTPAFAGVTLWTSIVFLKSTALRVGVKGSKGNLKPTEKVVAP